MLPSMTDTISKHLDIPDNISEKTPNLIGGELEESTMNNITAVGSNPNLLPENKNAIVNKSKVVFPEQQSTEVSTDSDKQVTQMTVSSDSKLVTSTPTEDIGKCDVSSGEEHASQDEVMRNSKTSSSSYNGKLPERDGCYLHYAEVLYKCSLCTTLPAIFTSPSHFSKHVREVHLSAIGVRCSNCQLSFTVTEDLRRHQTLLHHGSGVNNYPDLDESCSHRGLSPVTVPKYAATDCSCETTPGTNKCPHKGQPDADLLKRYSPGKDDDHDAAPCRSRRKRSFPRHLQMDDQNKRCTSVDSTSSCNSEDSQLSDAQEPLQHIDYSLLRSDRKRLLPWSQRTKVPTCDDSQRHQNLYTSPSSEAGHKPKATICYKPGSADSHRSVTPTKHPAEGDGSPHQSRNNSEPLDLAKHHASEVSDSAKQTQESTQSQHRLPEGSACPPDPKRRCLLGNPTITDSPYRTPDLPRLGYPCPSQYEAMYAWSMNFYNLSRHHALAQCEAGKNSVDSVRSGLLKEEVLETEKVNLTCTQCKLEFTTTEQFCQHYKEEHLPLSSSNCGQVSSAGDQQFKVLWLKLHLTRYVLPSDGGVVLRDELLDHMMGTGVDTSDAATWGPACNRAVRETFSDSQAHRKGKFKNYFFGVRFVDSLVSAEGTKPSLQPDDDVADDVTDEDEDEEVDEERGAVRGPCQELEKLTAQLPCVIRWTGHMDACITRDSLLQAMSRRLDDNDVINWGLQCSRAVRQLYPEVSIKRKGKYKTCYYGIEMIHRGGRHAQMTTWSRSTSGPPVVNVRDILETPGPSSMSRLPRHHQGAQGSQGGRACPESLKPGETATNPLQAILDLLPTSCQSNSMATPLAALRTNERTRMGERSVDRGNSPIAHNNTGNTTVSITSKNDSGSVAGSTAESFQNAPLSLTIKSKEKDDVISSESEQPLTSLQAGRSSATSGPVDALEKLVLLHPGPFVTTRIFSKRFQRLVPCLEKVLYAMNMLQGRGLGQVCTLKQGNSKVFFKALPSKSLEVPLTLLGVRMVDYQVMFYERDQKLEDTLHEKLKTFYPQPELLSTYYNH